MEPLSLRRHAVRRRHARRHLLSDGAAPNVDADGPRDVVGLHPASFRRRAAHLRLPARLGTRVLSGARRRHRVHAVRADRVVCVAGARRKAVRLGAAAAGALAPGARHPGWTQLGVGRIRRHDRARGAQPSSAAVTVSAADVGCLRAVSRAGDRRGRGQARATHGHSPPRLRTRRGCPRRGDGRDPVRAGARVCGVVDARRARLPVRDELLVSHRRAVQRLPAAVHRHPGEVLGSERHSPAQRISRRHGADPRRSGIRWRCTPSLPPVLDRDGHRVVPLDARWQHPILPADLRARAGHEVLPCAQHDHLRVRLLGLRAGRVGDGAHPRAAGLASLRLRLARRGAHHCAPRHGRRAHQSRARPGAGNGCADRDAAGL